MYTNSIMPNTAIPQPGFWFASRNFAKVATPRSPIGLLGRRRRLGTTRGSRHKLPTRVGWVPRLKQFFISTLATKTSYFSYVMITLLHLKRKLEPGKFGKTKKTSKDTVSCPALLFQLTVHRVAVLQREATSVLDPAMCLEPRHFFRNLWDVFLNHHPEF